MKKSVFGLASNQEQARRIVDHLLSSGFSNNDISILYPDSNKEGLRTNEHGHAEYRNDQALRNDQNMSGNASLRNDQGVRNDASLRTDHNMRSDQGVRHESDEKHAKKSHLHTEEHSKAPEGGVTGATAGGLLGGSLGLLAGIGALAIPGAGPFIAAGPIMAALSGSAVGGGLGLLLGSVFGSMVPELEVKAYEAALKQGNILISVHTNTDEEINSASDIMKKEGAKSISTTSEKAKM